MKFFDRYGFDIREGDTIQNIETGNLLEVTEISDEIVTYTIASSPFSPTYNIPTSNDGKNFVLQSRKAGS